MTIETEGDLADVLPWIAELSLRDVSIEPCGLTSVYERFHQLRGGHVSLSLLRKTFNDSPLAAVGLRRRPVCVRLDPRHHCRQH